MLEHEVGVDHGGDALCLRGGLKEGKAVKKEKEHRNSAMQGLLMVYRTDAMSRVNRREGKSLSCRDFSFYYYSFTS